MNMNMNKSNSRSGTPKIKDTSNKIKSVEMNDTNQTNFNSTIGYNHSDMNITQKQN